MKCIIDGSNVCNWSQNRFRFEPLLTLCCALEKQGENYLCLFDSSAHGLAKGLGRDWFYEQLLERVPDKFSEVPGGIQADEFLLQQASDLQLKIISNDRYRQFHEQFPWLASQETERLIKGGVVGGRRFAIPSLRINEQIFDFDRTWEELRAFLFASVVTIRAANNAFVCAELGSNRHLIANRPLAKDWEKFTMIRFQEGRFALRACDGLFVSPDSENQGQLHANRNYCGEWEIFEEVVLPKNCTAFKAFNGKYVAADFNKEGQLFANRDRVGEWENFVVRPAATKAKTKKLRRRSHG